jgi:hypothetical protein
MPNSSSRPALRHSFLTGHVTQMALADVTSAPLRGYISTKKALPGASRQAARSIQKAGASGAFAPSDPSCLKFVGGGPRRMFRGPLGCDNPCAGQSRRSSTAGSPQPDCRQTSILPLMATHSSAVRWASMRATLHPSHPDGGEPEIAAPGPGAATFGEPKDAEAFI